MALAKRYLWGERVDELLAQEDVTKNVTAADRVLWPIVDHLGTVRDLVKQDGTVATHFVYDAFGGIVSGDTSLTRYLFTSREFDVDTGLQYNRARWYDASTGRWISEDPLGFAAGDVNTARYVGSNPVRAGDASGLTENDVDYSEAALYAQLCEAAYCDSVGDANKVIPDGWSTIALFKNKRTGIQVAVFENNTTNQVVIAFAGTDPTSLADWMANGWQYTGNWSRQYQHAVDFLRDSRRRLQDRGELVVTGHSLGGGLATLVALLFDIPAIVFNPPELHSRTLEHYDANPTKASDLVDIFSLSNDPLSNSRAGDDAIGKRTIVPSPAKGLDAHSIVTMRRALERLAREEKK